LFNAVKVKKMLDEVLTIPLQQEAQIPVIGFSDGSETTDEMLVRAVLDGDEQAFAEIFERYRRVVARVVSRFFRDRAEIEEFVQQSFTKAYFSLNKFRGGRGDSFPAWVTRITVNVCYDEFRRRTRRGETSFSEIGENAMAAAEMFRDDSKPSAESALASAELAQRILSSLDPKDRIALTLVYTEECSLNDAANILGISTSNLKSRLFRCRNQIKKRFGHLFV
jgi:RNA polymerase sigma-70 factor, ECF subfamily